MEKEEIVWNEDSKEMERVGTECKILEFGAEVYI